MVDSSWPIDIYVNIILWSSFQVEFERVINGLGGQKECLGVNINILGSKHKSAIWDETPPTCISILIYMCLGELEGHKYSNRIQLS